MSEQTPIPAEALEAAAKVAFRRYQNEYTVSPNLTWRDFVAEIHEFVEVVAPILLAAGRTAAAADIRDAQYPDPSPCIPAWHAGYTEAWERAARVAENGADR